MVVLVNALYFKGTSSWKRARFILGKHENEFVTVQKQVDRTTSTHDVESGENLLLDCKILKLPYKGGICQ